MARRVSLCYSIEITDVIVSVQVDVYRVRRGVVREIGVASALHRHPKTLLVCEPHSVDNITPRRCVYEQRREIHVRQRIE